MAIPSIILITFCKFFWGHKICWKEWLCQLGAVGVSTLLCLGLLAMAGVMKSHDFDVINGYVTSKDRDEVSCSHSYQCGETCTTSTSRDSKGKATTSRSCSPKYCHEHSYDVDWDVRTSLGTRYTIDRIDRRGLGEPPRWSDVEVGDPASETEMVRNYLLIDDNRFKTDPTISAKYVGVLPSYPLPYDYYNFYRVVDDTKQDYDDINIWLNNQLTKDAVLKQMNIILVVTKNGPDYFYALMEYWKGPRKNDVILFYGVDDNEQIQWAKAMSFADGQNNQILLKQLQTLTYERAFGIDVVKEQYALIKKDFNRVPNEDFAYMTEAIDPPTWWVVLLVLLNLSVTGAITYFFIKEDVFQTKERFA
jgi:hypothetical protein